MSVSTTFSPPRRRKSSFFCRYEIALINDQENTDDSPTKAVKMEVNREEVITNHTAEMKKEITDWKNFCQKTKLKYENIARQKNVIIDSTNLLTEDDLEFIKQKPDFGNLGRRIIETAEKFEIVKNNVSLLNSRVKLSGKMGSNRVHELKMKVCSYLLNHDEINESRFDDSANYSMESGEISHELDL